MGRISLNDLGIWSDAHAEALASIVKSCKEGGARVGIPYPSAETGKHLRK